MIKSFRCGMGCEKYIVCCDKCGVPATQHKCGDSDPDPARAVNDAIKAGFKTYYVSSAAPAKMYCQECFTNVSSKGTK